MFALLTVVSTLLAVVTSGVSFVRRATARRTARMTVPPVFDEPIAAPWPGRYVPQCLRVLVVDDRPLIGAQVARMLSAHDVTHVTSADAALAHARQGEFDAILYALTLRGRSGLAFADLLAAERPALRPRLVLLLDCAPSPSLLAKLRGARWITTPLRYAALATAVTEAAESPAPAAAALAA